MVDVRIEEKPAFRVVGESTWISGQDNEQFGRFWDKAHSEGLIDRLRALNGGEAGSVTGATTFGVSCVDKDPNDRAFTFFIAAECDGEAPQGLESREIPACTWAIFRSRGELPMALIEAEMHAFMEWLPKSGYRHDNAPELEVYPTGDEKEVEFWLPVTR